MKTLIAIVALALATASFAQPAKQPAPEKIATKEQTNCVTKDKKGNCPPPPKSAKPTPKKKVDEKK
jgi:Ni/Co efflux regulator RcnB